MQRRSTLTGFAALAATAATFGPLGSMNARAQGTKLAFGYTGVAEFASLFVAKEEGYFGARGLDIEPRLIPLNSTIPAALLSDSLQLGGPTASVFLQSVDSGLDLVVVAGGGGTDKRQTSAGLVVRNGVDIKAPPDCVGKKIGVPGIGTLLHVSFRANLLAAGVDPKQVSFVEVSFPQHTDVLRGGSIDAVVSADPFLSRIVQAGVGTRVEGMLHIHPDGTPTILYAARRDWAQKNPVQLKAFREAVQEAAAFMLKPENEATVRAHIGKYIKMPPEALARAQVAPPQPIVTAQHLAYWVDLMKKQDMLKSDIKVASLLAA
jgi:NitT/TauT family transport system substrate-binding protein